MPEDIRTWSITRNKAVSISLFLIIKLTDALSNVLSPTPIAKTGRPWEGGRTTSIKIRKEKEISQLSNVILINVNKSVHGHKAYGGVWLVFGFHFQLILCFH